MPGEGKKEELQAARWKLNDSSENNIGKAASTFDCISFAASKSVSVSAHTLFYLCANIFTYICVF